VPRLPSMMISDHRGPVHSRRRSAAARLPQRRRTRAHTSTRRRTCPRTESRPGGT
jgi:hypothetical protein